MRPKISLVDLKLRLFLDTNILIDYIEDFDGNKAKTFINLFSRMNFKNIELITSDYVLWEFYGHSREDMYVKKMIIEKDWGYNRARRGIKDFNEATIEDMLSFGKEIDKRIHMIDDIVTIQRIMSETTEGFSEMLEQLLQFSKFSYRDSLILISAIYTKSHMILTIDHQFKAEGSRTAELEKEKESLPADFLVRSGLIDLIFRKPEDLSTEQNILKNYKEWFINRNKKNEIGKVTDHLRQKNIIYAKCNDDYTLKINDYVYLVKFLGNEAFIKLFQIKHGDFKDYETNNDIEESERGGSVTIKLPNDFNPEKINLINSMLFLSNE